MASNFEHLQLPTGFVDRGSEWVRRKRVVLEHHARIGEKIGCELIETAPLSFASTFQRATCKRHGNMFAVKHRGAREVILSCDSLSSVLRRFCNSLHEPVGARYSFVSPIFRQSNLKSRYVHQIGYASINERYDDAYVDSVLVSLAGSMVDLIRSVGIEPTVKVGDFAHLRSHLADQGLLSKDTPEFFRSLTPFDRAEGFAQGDDPRIKDPRFHNLQEFIEKSESSHLHLPEQTAHFIKILAEQTGAAVHFDPLNMHDWGSISGLGLRFVSADGKPLADGGQYNDFGNQFDKNIASVRSVATGVEILERVGTFKLQRQVMPHTGIIGTYDVSDSFIGEVESKLILQGHAVLNSGRTSNVKMAMRKLISQGVDNVVIIGSIEEAEGSFVIRAINQRS